MTLSRVRRSAPAGFDIGARSRTASLRGAPRTARRTGTRHRASGPRRTARLDDEGGRVVGGGPAAQSPRPALNLGRVVEGGDDLALYVGRIGAVIAAEPP